MRMEADGIMEGFKQKLRDLLERLGVLPAEGVHYIGGSDTLPPPLSKEREKELLGRVEEECARQELIEHNLRLVVYIARRFENTGVGIEDLEEDVDRSLLNAAVNTLSPREKQIITLRFGLGGGRERTQKEVADQLGISQSYISRLEKRIITRLKKEILRLS